MLTYKKVDVEQLDADLKSVADKIREKGGTTEDLNFPNGFISAVDDIQTGGEPSQTDLLNMTDWSHLCRERRRLHLLQNGLLKGGKPTNCDYFLYNTQYSCDFDWISIIDMSNVTTAKHMLSSCKFGANTKVVPKLETSSLQDASYMFSNSSEITTIFGLDMNSIKTTSNMLQGVKNIANLTLYNIRTSVQIGGGSNYSNVLTVDSLVHTIRELCKTASATLTIGTTNLEKIANLYCKVLDEEDEKMPFELCESTDEGAMLLTDYAFIKGWEII